MCSVFELAIRGHGETKESAKPGIILAIILQL